MKVKVVMPFKDKVTNRLHNTGEVFDCTAERFAEIRKAGNYVVEEKAVTETKLEKAVKAE